jgi:hypothetical protein
VDKAVSQVELAFQTDMTKPITFELDLVLPPTITPGLLLPLLKTRLARFPGITSILVKNLDTSEMVYESQADYILSGMSIAKVAIMVEVYRYFRGVVDEQIHQELLDMMGSQSCNSCANRLLAAVGGGSGYTGAERVTKTMQRLGLENFRFCAPYRREAWWDAPQISNGIVWTASANFSQLGSSWFAQSELPDYDRCIRTTPREMANLMEMIYLCTQEQGLIRKTFPEISSQMCQEMIDIMAANDLRNMLGAGIPRGVKIAHKHGYTGTTEWGDTRGEVGIIFSRRATYLISFCIWQDTTWIDFGIMQPLYRDVSNMIYNYFNPDESYWPLPPWTPPPTK